MRGERVLSRYGLNLVYIFVVTMVIPIIDLPLLGLSLSAPIFFLIVLEVVFRSSGFTLKPYSRWIMMVYVLWMGLLLSFGGNVIFGRLGVSIQQVISWMTYYLYWLMVFIFTIWIFTNTRAFYKLPLLIGCCIFLMAFVRLFEAVVFQRFGLFRAPVVLPQNNYGLLFSTFTPYLLLLTIQLKGRWRLASSTGLVLLWLIIILNGSRSSWIAVSIGIVLFLLIYVLAYPQKVIYLALAVIMAGVLFGAGLVVLPPEIRAAMDARAESFNDLEADKSFVIRELMIQKGLRLFEQNPFFGAGPGQFRASSVPLDIPILLQYADQEHFDVKSSHNSYVGLLGETGLVGMIPYLVLFSTLLVVGLISVVRCARRGELWAIPVYCSFIGMSIHLWSLSGLTDTATWFVYALAAAMIHTDMTHSARKAA